MNSFSRSWNITKLTFGIMNKDKELYLYPIFSTVSTIIFFLLIAFISIFSGLINIGEGNISSTINYVILFISYLGVAFIGSFFSTCVVYTAKNRFEGSNATISSSIGFSIKRIHKILLWSILAATVGLVLKMIENFAQKIKGVGGIIIQVSNSIIGMAWNIATMFVIQGITYKDLGPFDAVKDSTLTIKKTWGEALIKYIGFGITEFIFIFIGIIIGFPLIILGFLTGIIALGIAGICLLIIYLLIVILTFNIANQIYNTALYVYANTGKIPDGYNEEVIKNAFSKKVSH